MSAQADLVEAFELHSPAGVRRSLAAGASPVAPIGGKRPIDILIEMYTRSPKFAECLAVMAEAGAVHGDPLIDSVLSDDPKALAVAIQSAGEADAIRRRFTLLAAYTSCRDVTALHLCAEFNSVQCARLLIEAGADVNAAAGVDSEGLGGQTPLFHCVNSNQNYCRPTMDLLLESGANVDLRLRGLVWGDTMDWETVLFDVTPISYAQCGLYRQFHREEPHIYGNLQVLYARRYGAALPIRNVPNRYLFPAH